MQDIVNTILTEIEFELDIKSKNRGIQKMIKGHIVESGPHFGLSDLDKLAGGFTGSNLIIAAGRPNSGKTVFCMNILRHVSIAQQGKSAAVFSPAVSGTEFARKLLSLESEIKHSRLCAGTLSSDEWPKLAAATERLLDAHIYFDDSRPLGILALQKRVRGLKREHGIELVLIDHLQLITASRTTKKTKQQILSSLRALSEELKITIIAISLLESKVKQTDDNRPDLFDHDELSVLEQNADVVLLVDKNKIDEHEENENNGSFRAIVVKDRHGSRYP